MGKPPLASLICPAPECRKFQAVPQSCRGTVISCRFCGARIDVPADQQGLPRLADESAALEGGPR